MALHEIDEGITSTTCCVAKDISDYITKAVRLGRDVLYHKKVSFGIKKRNYRIFDDFQTSYEWSKFLSRALGVAHDVFVGHLDDNDDDESNGNSYSFDEILAKEMNYSPQTWQLDPFLDREFRYQQQKWKESKMETSIGV